MFSGNRAGAAAVAATVALGGALLGAAPAQAATASFNCADKAICIFDNADGSDAGFEVAFMWAGGFLLTPKGWNDRASAFANNTDYTKWMYSRSDDDTCWILRATIAPRSSGPLAPEADNNVDMVANQEYTTVCA
ncbi:peptidase inhibitor family I36 protein [Pseudonocardia sp. GCM10023141]|uniref:peptidase inhibitor family I36 protein n=1 Tax=Pseudonocardia sp. GCM10023141 TaxID=3252653 RepID=UPI003611E393